MGIDRRLQADAPKNTANCSCDLIIAALARGLKPGYIAERLGGCVLRVGVSMGSRELRTPDLNIGIYGQ